MKNRKTILVVSFLAVCAAYILTEKDYGPVHVAVKSLLGKYPDLELDFNAPPLDADKKNVIKRFPTLGLRCYSERSELGDYVCWADIGKYNGIPAKLAAIFFEGNDLSKIRIAFNGWNHKKVLEHLRREHGEPELTSHKGIHGESMITWSMDSGIIAASATLEPHQESVVLWTGNRAIFGKLIGKVEQLVKSENETKQIVPQRPAGNGKTPNITEYNSDGGYYRSLLEVRKIPVTLNHELMSWIKTNARRLPSPFLMELANRVYPSDRQEAMKWFAAFRLISAYDAARCRDKTAAQGAAQVYMLYPQLGDHARNDAQTYASALPAALQWAKEQDFRGSPAWLCAHGISAFRFDQDDKPVPVPVEELVYPEADWPGIWNRVIAAQEALP